MLNTIRDINADRRILGCLLLRPLPNKEDEEAAYALLSPEKDVDCMTDRFLTSVFTGKGKGYPPCTAQACTEMLDYYGVEIQGKRVALICRSLVIGKPVSMMLHSRNATVTMCHSKTIDLAEICKNSNILITAAGKAGVVDDTYVGRDQIVLDVGINIETDGKLCGDVAFDKVESIVSKISPVPGGVGSVTTAVLAKHVIETAEKVSA